MKVPVSLLDLLSCSLAVVVILLIISLNTGLGEEDELDQIKVLELSLYDQFIILEDSEFSLQFRNKTYSIPTVMFDPYGTDELLELRFPESLDSMLNIRSMLYDFPRSLQYIRNTEIQRGKKMEFTIPTYASGATLIWTFDTDRDRSLEFLSNLSINSRSSQRKLFNIPPNIKFQLEIICRKKSIYLRCTNLSTDPPVQIQSSNLPRL